jgi:hypothetical protein
MAVWIRSNRRGIWRRRVRVEASASGEGSEECRHRRGDRFRAGVRYGIALIPWPWRRSYRVRCARANRSPLPFTVGGIRHEREGERRILVVVIEAVRGGELEIESLDFRAGIRRTGESEPLNCVKRDGRIGEAKADRVRRAEKDEFPGEISV